MLTPMQIKTKIDMNNELIESLFDPTGFVLDKRIQSLMEENDRLRAECVHDYDEDGVCKYCYSIKED